MNKLKGIILVVISALASIMMPFNIYADQLPQTEIIGVDYNLISYSQDVNNSGVTFYNYTYEIEIKLNDNYVGVVDGTLTFNWMNQDTSTGNPTSHNSSNKRKSYVNGNSFKTNIVIQGSYSTFTGKGPLTSVSYLVDNSDTNVVKYQDLDSIETVVNLLQDIYQNSTDIENLSTNQLAELENIVSNTSLANDYLEFIQDHIPWNFPIESLSAIGRMLNNSYINDGTYELMDYHVINRWTFPLFAVRVADFDYNNATIYPKGTNAQDKIYFVVCTNSAHVSYWNRWFTITQGGTVTESQTITRFNMPNPDTGVSQAWGIYRYTIQFEGGTASKSVHVRFINNPTFFIPIYWGYSQSTSLAVSTDFALQFGLKNEFLENLDVLANGNTESNSASEQLDSDTSDFVTDRDDLIDIEDTMGNNMDSAMNQITPSNNGLSGFGGNFLTSAVWVRTQFERLTNNTPYGSLIVYGMTLGLALLLLGKVML